MPPNWSFTLYNCVFYEESPLFPILLDLIKALLNGAKKLNSFHFTTLVILLGMHAMIFSFIIIVIIYVLVSVGIASKINLKSKNEAGKKVLYKDSVLECYTLESNPAATNGNILKTSGEFERGDCVKNIYTTAAATNVQDSIAGRLEELLVSIPIHSLSWWKVNVRLFLQFVDTLSGTCTHVTMNGYSMFPLSPPISNSATASTNNVPISLNPSTNNNSNIVPNDATSVTSKVSANNPFLMAKGSSERKNAEVIGWISNRFFQRIVWIRAILLCYPNILNTNDGGGMENNFDGVDMGDEIETKLWEAFLQQFESNRLVRHLEFQYDRGSLNDYLLFEMEISNLVELNEMGSGVVKGNSRIEVLESEGKLKISISVLKDAMQRTVMDYFFPIVYQGNLQLLCEDLLSILLRMRINTMKNQSMCFFICILF
jgi:hypothetical protein